MKNPTDYTISGVSQFLSVPYALYAGKAANGFSGDYNDLTNKPVIDGSETKIQAGNNITVSGTGTIPAPYIINAKSNPYPPNNKQVITSSQTWNVPASVSKIKVELWGAAGGGGGAGSYSYSLNMGGFGGSGGYAQKEYNVTENQQFSVTIGTGGNAGTNAYYWYPYWYGDSSGENGGNSYFADMVASGGSGGMKGSYAATVTNGYSGTANYGTITGYSEVPGNYILDLFTGLERSYISDRFLTSKPGKGGSVSGYSTVSDPTSGESGVAIITLFE